MIQAAFAEELLTRIVGDASQYLKTLEKAAAATAAFGVGVAAIVGTASVKAFASFEQSLADMSAAANVTGPALEQLRGTVERLARSAGMDPNKIADALGEMAKAGVALDQIMGGAAESVIRFARVGKLEIAGAAKILKDAQTIFGGTFDEIANVINRAADASTIGISDIVEGFRVAGGTLKDFGQNMADVSQAIAMLGARGMSGSDAGTVLKTMFLRMAAGSGEAQAAIDRLNLQFYGADGQMKGFRDIIVELEAKLGGLGRGTEEYNKALAELFGDRGIRGGTALLAIGSKGWDEFAASMAGSLSVQEKYERQTSTLRTQWDRLSASLQILLADLGEKLAPAVRAFGDAVEQAMQAWRDLPEVRAALQQLFDTLVGVGQRAFHALARIAADAWARITGQEFTFDSLGRALVDALIKVEYAVLQVEARVVRFVDEADRKFGFLLPKLEMVVGLLDAMVPSVDAVAASLDALSGGPAIDAIFGTGKPGKAAAALPKLPDFETFRKERMAQFLQFAAEARKALDNVFAPAIKAPEVKPPTVPKPPDPKPWADYAATLDRVEAAAFGSAEALSRIADFRDRMAMPKAAGGMKPAPATAQQKVDDDQLDQLEKQTALLQQIRDKRGVELSPAGLG